MPCIWCSLYEPCKIEGSYHVQDFGSSENRFQLFLYFRISFFFFPLCLLVSQSLGFALEVCPARFCNLALCIQVLDPYRRCCTWLSSCSALLWVQVRRENGSFGAEACPHLNPMKSFNFNALPIVMVYKDVSKICLTSGTILKTLIKQFKDFLVVLLGTHSPSHHCPCNLFLLLPWK